MLSFLNYQHSVACQLCFPDLTPEENLAVTISGAGNPTWALFGLAFNRNDISTIATAVSGNLRKLSTVHMTIDTVSITASIFKNLARHGSPGPQIPAVIMRVYLWASQEGAVTLSGATVNQSSIGFTFGHDEAVDEWTWIDARNPANINWPAAAM